MQFEVFDPTELVKEHRSLLRDAEDAWNQRMALRARKAEEDPDQTRPLLQLRDMFTQGGNAAVSDWRLPSVEVDGTTHAVKLIVYQLRRQRNGALRESYNVLLQIESDDYPTFHDLGWVIDEDGMNSCLFVDDPHAEDETSKRADMCRQAIQAAYEYAGY